MAYHDRKFQRSLILTGVILVVGLALQGAVAVAPASGQEPSTTETEWVLPGGTLSVQLPADWESNPRLAEDNVTTGFLHPSGMEPEQVVPVWVVIEHRLVADVAFDDFLVQCLEEGNSRGFVFQDKVSTETADGRLVLTYAFNPSESGEPRRLSFLRTPRCAVLLRQQAADEATWKASEPVLAAILASIRFTEEKPGD